MDALTQPEQKTALLAQIRRESELELGRASQSHPSAENPMPVSSIPPAERIPQPPAWGVRVVRAMPLQAVAQHLSLNELFRLSWGGKNTHGQAWVDLQAQFQARLNQMLGTAGEWLAPQGVYGCFPAQSEGNDLVIYEPGSVQTGAPAELTRFSFPRQSSGEFLCLADYFAPAASGRMDTVVFQVVTVGQAATHRFEALQAANNYTEAYFTHGLAVQMAEAAADYLHQHIRRELGLPAGQGKRYSWGYPAIPELADHAKVFELLPAQTELGMSLTSAFQLVPEQSTAAIIVHHPLAKYFNIGESRIDQLTGA